MMSSLWEVALVEEQPCRGFVNCGKIKGQKKLEFLKWEISYFIPIP